MGRWSMPQVRLPCTLECPRTGEGPTPPLPMFPRSISTLTISRTASTPCSCWVTPRHQEITVFPDSRYRLVSCMICPRETPDWATMSSHGVASTSSR